MALGFAEDNIFYPDWFSGSEDQIINYPEYGLAGWLVYWRIYPLTMLLGLVLAPTYLAVLMRRYHDVGRNSWPAILFFGLSFILPWIDPAQMGGDAGVPVIPSSQGLLGFVFTTISPAYLALVVLTFGLAVWLIIVGILPGQTKPNRYGPDPKGRDFEAVFE